MAGRVRVIFEGDEFDFLGRSGGWNDLDAAFRDRILSEGVIVVDRAPMEEKAANRLRSRHLSTFAEMPRGSRFDRSAVFKWLIPDFWPWGHKPVLGGNPKAGKSTLVFEFIAALTIAGYRFLDHFEPADLSNDPRHERLDVLIINAEMPREDYEAGCVALGIDLASPWLTILHLEDLQTSFDVTDPKVYEAWLDWLVYCNECDGSDFSTPSVVIVDGLTAILGGDTGRYGAWYPRFRQLMKESDIPNALVIGHATLAGDHLMGGVEGQAGGDGNWIYSMDNADRPASPRRLKMIPRGPRGVAMNPTRVRIIDGRLRLDVPNAGEGQPVATGGDNRPKLSDDDRAEEEVRARLQPVGTRVMSAELTGGGEEGKRLRRARDRLHERGELLVHPVGRQGKAWELVPLPVEE